MKLLDINTNEEVYNDIAYFPLLTRLFGTFDTKSDKNILVINEDKELPLKTSYIATFRMI